MYVDRGGGGSHELRTSFVNSAGLEKSDTVSLLIFEFLKSSVPQFSHLQGEVIDLQPICLVEGRESANEEEEASAFWALGWGRHFQPPKLAISISLGRYQLGY